MSNIKTVSSGTDIIKVLPSGESFSLSKLEGWNDLTLDQQTYLSVYVDTVGQKTLAKSLSGLTQSKVDSFNDDDNYVSTLADIEALLTEGLKALDYIDSLTNSKIRGRVIQARESGSYTKDTQKNTLNVFADGQKGLREILNALTPPNKD